MPSFAIWAIARWSWAPQSQRPEPKTSPVRHAEWTRTRTGSSSVQVSHHEGDVLLVRELGAVRDDAELAVRRREERRRDAVHEALGPHPVPDDVGDRDDRDAVLLRDEEEVRHAGHRPVLVHDLADHGGGREPRDPREVDGRLRLPRPLEDAALLGARAGTCGRAAGGRAASSSGRRASARSRRGRRPRSRSSSCRGPRRRR